MTNESENDDEPNVTPPPSPEGDDNVSNVLQFYWKK